MAGSVNKVILVGNLGDDPKIITGQNGKFCELSIATGESWKDRETGERKEVTDWHRVKIFSEPLVKFAEQYLKKGHKVYVEGKQKTRRWEKDGVTHYTTEVVLANFGGVLQSLQKSEGGPRGDSPDDYGTPSSKRTANDAIDDEIPF
jgi:single-strand DNA-binding protein